MDDKSYVAECATEYWSPCCESEGIYAHFFCPTGNIDDEYLAGFQCTGCGKNYDVSCKDDFDT